MNPRLIVICFILVVTSATAQQKPLVPQIDGGWWQIAKNPDLGKYNGEKQQPVDFAIWQAADGTWQLWSCIRGTKCPGKVTNRLLFGWEGKNLTDKLWTPKGIQLMADTTLGEINGGMQAPYVFMEDNVYYLFYGDWRRICLAKGYDGKRFTRVLGGNGEPDLFTEHSFEPSPNNTARDPMILKCVAADGKRRHRQYPRFLENVLLLANVPELFGMINAETLTYVVGVDILSEFLGVRDDSGLRYTL
jgi:hypothetical protein